MPPAETPDTPALPARRDTAWCVTLLWLAGLIGFTRGAQAILWWLADSKTDPDSVFAVGPLAALAYPLVWLLLLPRRAAGIEAPQRLGIFLLSFPLCAALTALILALLESTFAALPDLRPYIIAAITALMLGAWLTILQIFALPLPRPWRWPWLLANTLPWPLTGALLAVAMSRAAAVNLISWLFLPHALASAALLTGTYPTLRIAVVLRSWRPVAIGCLALLVWSLL